VEKPLCSICASQKVSQDWFLITENRWEDRLRIVEWHEALSRTAGVHAACSVAHVRELVIHWMTTGSLHYPFAAVAGHNPAFLRRSIWAPRLEVDTRPARLIGEISVDRTRIGRLLEESAGLASLLSGLDTALRKDEPSLHFKSHKARRSAEWCEA